MRLIQHNHAVFGELGVLQAFAQQRAVGQVLDARETAGTVLKAHSVSHLLAEAAVLLLRYAAGHGDGSLTRKRERMVRRRGRDG
jgi:hypothetical protein